MSDNKLQTLLKPKSVAIIGASDDPSKIGGRPIEYLKRFGFDGSIFPVNPQRETVQGQKSYPTIGDVPGPVDLAIIAIPAEGAVRAAHECAAANVGTAIIFSSGFSESGTDGTRAQQMLSDIAQQSNMNILGPNCQGVVSTGTRLVASFSSVFAESEIAEGPSAIVSQSGAVAAMTYQLVATSGGGIQYCIATGNESDITVSDVVGEVLQDPKVRVVQLYLEDIKDAAGLAEAATISKENGKAILALKSGRTAEGTVAASSHTGALAGDDSATDAFFYKHGIVRVDSIVELAAYGQVFGQGKPTSGRRVAVLSNSGGLGVMLVDECKALGLEMASLGEETTAALAELLPAFAVTANPVDVTTQLMFDQRLLSRLLPVLMSDPDVDAVVCAFGMMGKGYDVDAMIEDIAHANEDHDTLLGVAWVGGRPGVAAELGSRGVPATGDPNLLMRSFAAYIDFGLQPDTHVTSVPAVGKSTVDAQDLEVGRDIAKRYWEYSHEGYLSEYNSKLLLEETGVLRMTDVLFRPATDDFDQLEKLNFPLVAKASSPAILHKSEHGLVSLGIGDLPALAAAIEALDQRAMLQPSPEKVEGVLIQEMVADGFEAFVGVHHDPSFGNIVVVGAGGIFIEVFQDFQSLVAPISYEYALDAIKRLHAFPIMNGARGGPRSDYESLAELVVRVGSIAERLGDSLLELDLNPVKVLPAGRGVAVLDALIKLRDPNAQETPK